MDEMEKAREERNKAWERKWEEKINSIEGRVKEINEGRRGDKEKEREWDEWRTQVEQWRNEMKEKKEDGKEEERERRRG